MQGWVNLVGWLHTVMVYPPKDGHPSQYNRAQCTVTSNRSMLCHVRHNDTQFLKLTVGLALGLVFACFSVVSLYYFVLVLFAFVALSLVLFATTPRDWLRKSSPKWSNLRRVRRRTYRLDQWTRVACDRTFQWSMSSSLRSSCGSACFSVVLAFSVVFAGNDFTSTYVYCSFCPAWAPGSVE